MAKEKSFMLMEICIKEIGLIIKQMDLECTSITMVLCIRGIGLTIFKTERGLNFGQMVVNMKDSINKGRSMGRAFIYGLIKVITKVIGIKIKSMVSDSMFGVIIENILENGS
jgi:hypothetical protein